MRCAEFDVMLCELLCDLSYRYARVLELEDNVL
jgi:hypothetical protein